MIVSLVIISVFLIGIFAWNEMDKSNHEKKMEKHADSFNDTLVEINKSALKNENHPAANYAKDMVEFRYEMQKWSSVGRDYLSDYRVVFGFLSFAITMNFKDISSDKEPNSKENYIWSPLISSWLSSSMLIDGDMRKAQGFEPSFKYHGVLTEHSVEESMIFLYKEVSDEKKKEEERLSSKMVTDFIEEYGVNPKLDNNVFFPNLLKFIKKNINARYT